jgi:TolB-like protein/Tfp pilus assembly protein PilF
VLSAGAHLGQFEIRELLGAGGMGEVYRATDTKLGRDVALKVLPSEMAGDPERLERFQREAKALAALDHPGIVTVFSVEQADGVHFLTMQLVDGQPLDQLIPEGGMPVERILETATALAEALAAAHDKGIVHRDLKPANVMVMLDGRVKVLDFGLAKVRDAVGEPGPTISHELTQRGAVMGTVPYMSPEQVSGRAVDQRTDIFSLGVMLYQMATGQRPFRGDTGAELSAAILRDAPPALEEARSDLPEGLRRVISCCLQKNADDRFPTAREAAEALRDLSSGPASITPTLTQARPTGATNAPSTGARRREEGFWVAVLPFKHSGSNADLTALAEGLSEEIVTGLSRFSYLRVIARSSTSRYAGEAVDVRSVGKELGARYVMEGSLRQAGSTLRASVQLLDASTGTHLWAETYNRTFRTESVFELQDDLVPRIVSTVADMHGVLPRTMSEAVRLKAADRLTPYEALLHSFGYNERFTPEALAEARMCLERAVEQTPENADCWAMLSLMYSNEYGHWDIRNPKTFEKALRAARTAVLAAPLHSLPHYALAQALFFRREFPASRTAAERAVSLNPMDGATAAFMGLLIAYSGDWKRGCALAKRGQELNPNLPGMYNYTAWHEAYGRKDYRAALDLALKLNTPDNFYQHAVLAMCYAQLGEMDAARRSLRDMLALKPDYGKVARQLHGKWIQPELVEQLMDGLRKAGLQIDGESGSTAAPVSSSTAESSPAAAGSGMPPRDSTAVSIAVLPFADMSAAKDQEYLCEGMAEEIMNALVRVAGMHVASRTSAFRAHREGINLPALAGALSVGHVLEGSVRTSGSRLRVTAQLTDAASGYQLWSERYDRDAGDVFAIQDEIAAGVVDAVRERLTPGTHEVRPRGRVSNLEAYRLYLKGRHLRYTKNDHAGALRAFEEAVRLDPGQARAWSGLAEVQVLAAFYGLIPVAAAHARAKGALETAVGLQGETVDSLYVAGLIADAERRFEDSERALRAAVELAPDHVEATCHLGVLLSVLGRFGEAAAVLQHARAVDALAPYPYAISSLCLAVAREPAQALDLAEQALALDEENTLALWVRGQTLVALGRLEEAVTLYERAVTPVHRGGMIHGMAGWAAAVAGDRAGARAALDAIAARPSGSPALVAEAWIRAELGDLDGAWEVLDRAEREGQFMLLLTGLPGFDRLSADPRFAELLIRLGLSPERQAPAAERSSRPPKGDTR